MFPNFSPSDILGNLFVNALYDALKNSPILDQLTLPVRHSLAEWIRQPEIQKALMDVSRKASEDFHAKASQEGVPDALIQALWSLPINDSTKFQTSLQQALLKDFNEDFIYDVFKAEINGTWRGKLKITDSQLSQAIDFYIYCLNRRLLAVREFRDGVSRVIASQTQKLAIEINKKVDAHFDISKNIEETVNDIKASLSFRVQTFLCQIRPYSRDFTGRKREIAFLQKAVRKGSTILILHGPGGIGKTDLASKLSEDLSEQYSDGQLFIDLKGSSTHPVSAVQAMQCVIRSFIPEIEPMVTEEEVVMRYQSLLRNKHMLIFLDDASCEEELRLLIPPSSCLLIITTRNIFSVPGATILKINPLIPRDAVALANKIHKLSHKDAEEISHACGYFPLAIRVAVSILISRPDMTPQDLLDQLAKPKTHFQLFDKIENTFELSYQTLSDIQKENFRKLYVFSSPFTKSAVSAVWGQILLADHEIKFNQLGYIEMSNSLGFLLTSSLLEYDLSTGRYLLHEEIRKFSENKASQFDSEYKDTLYKFAHYYLNDGAKSDSQYEQGNENIYLALKNFEEIWPHLQFAHERLEEWDNRLALEWLCSFPNKIANLLGMRLLPSLRLKILESAQEAASRLGEKKLEGNHLGNIGRVLHMQGRGRDAILFFQRSLKLHHQVRDLRSESLDFGNIGNIYAEMGESENALVYYKRALVVAQKIKDAQCESLWIGNIGNIYCDKKDHASAIKYLCQALDISRRLGDQENESYWLGNLANNYLLQGDIEKALIHNWHALKIAKRMKNKYAEGSFRENLGRIFLERQKYTAALQSFDNALEISKVIDNRMGEAEAFWGKGLVYKKLNKYPDAIKMFSYASAIFRNIDDPRVSEVELQLNQIAEASFFENRI